MKKEKFLTFIITLIQSYLEDDDKSHKKKDHDNNLIWIGEWFGVVFSTLQETCNFSEDTLDLIRSLKIFVLCDGSFVSLKEQTVFFPIEADMVKNKKSSKWKIWKLFLMTFC